ncbi:MAG TPA: heavy-metal-associated domain-containing protein [Candidatus Dormibacteraeota bacterium]|nr:heavy-metal-associated domain-containing protein [Candidatus Dormibacteraeota bacterium]
MSTVVLNVPDISCAHCERTITEALQPVQGVHEVGVDIPARTVRVAYDEGAVTVERLHEVLAEADYPVAAPR